MDGLERENNSLTFLDKCWIASEATMNASCIDRNGNSHKLMNTAIDTNRITTLAEYMRSYDPTKIGNLDPSKQDNEKLMTTYVIPITLQSGEKIDVIINQKGQDMACVFLDEEGKQNNFVVTPRMQKEILSNGMRNIEGIIDTELAREMLVPKTLEEFEKEVAEDTLVPKNAKETVEKIKAKDPEADIREAGESDEKEGNQEQEKDEAEIPEDAKDAVAKFREQYKGGKLKQILVVDDPASINDKLDGNTGITQNRRKSFLFKICRQWRWNG